MDLRTGELVRLQQAVAACCQGSLVHLARCCQALALLSACTALRGCRASAPAGRTGHNTLCASWQAEQFGTAHGCREADLGNAARGDWCRVEEDKDVGQPGTESSLHDALGVREAVLGRLGVQLGKLAADVRWEQVWACGSPLPPFDEGWPRSLKGPPHQLHSNIAAQHAAGLGYGQLTTDVWPCPLKRPSIS